MSRHSPGQQKEPGSGEGGRPGSDQMPPPIDVDAIARGFGPQGPILLNKMVHGLFDAFIPIFLLLCPPRAWRQQFRLRFNLPHRGQRGVTAALRLFTLDTKGRGASGAKAGRPDRGGGVGGGAVGSEVRCKLRGSELGAGSERQTWGGTAGAQRHSRGARAETRGLVRGRWPTHIREQEWWGRRWGRGPHHHRAATVVLETIRVALGSQPYTLLRLWGPDTGEESEQGSASSLTTAPPTPTCPLSLVQTSSPPHPAPAWNRCRWWPPRAAPGPVLKGARRTSPQTQSSCAPNSTPSPSCESGARPGGGPCFWSAEGPPALGMHSALAQTWLLGSA